jgi:hypothetical protein
MACFIGEAGPESRAPRKSDSFRSFSFFCRHFWQRFKGGRGIFTDVRYFGQLRKAGTFQAIDKASWLKAEISTLVFAGLHQAFRIGSGIT